MATEESEPSADYILTTATHNYVSRNAQLQGAQQIELRGRSIIEPGVVICGDLERIRIGRYTHLHANIRIEPPHMPTQQEHVPVSIGSYTVIHENVQSQAAAIGSFCWIGQNVKLGPRVILKDACVVANDVTIPSDTVVPPFTRVDANNHWIEMPPSITVELQERAMQWYQDFAELQNKK